MAQFSMKARRFDPYKNFKFRVRWDGKDVAGVSKVSSLKRTTEVIKHREGGDPSSSRKSPGRTEYEAVTLDTNWTAATAIPFCLHRYHAGTMPRRRKKKCRYYQRHRTDSCGFGKYRGGSGVESA